MSDQCRFFLRRNIAIAIGEARKRRLFKQGQWGLCSHSALSNLEQKENINDHQNQPRGQTKRWKTITPLRRWCGQPGSNRHRIAPGRLVVWQFDRLARSLRHLLETIEKLESQEMKFHSLTEAIDTWTSRRQADPSVLGRLPSLNLRSSASGQRRRLETARLRGEGDDKENSSLASLPWLPACN
ncbi:recombinase family protein [Asticcacaulis sp. AC466]|uniref:recombinase family protein n=1 Tax=Asticcacaulis sp. AC466 TaxID=1282362 RepID=UPI00190FB4C7